MASIITASRLEREVFHSSDGRILGREIRVDEWFTPFSGKETVETETVVDTAGPFSLMSEAALWKDELYARLDVERAEAYVASQQ